MRRAAFVVLGIFVASQAAYAENPIKEGHELAERVRGSWKACLISSVDRYSRTSEPAEVVADVAFTQCAEWDTAVKTANSHQLAVALMHQMPFERGLKAAEDNADDYLVELKAALKPQLMARVMDKRMTQGAK